ncbi:MAG: FAD-dependent oxidoreductase [Hyphomicrobiales bacterium]|nr:FAD-dependent oxidoreductase [Hyphomicrobiales bacterium]
MSVLSSLLWTDSTTESRLTGTWRRALPNYKNVPAPCFGACPVDGEIAIWVRQSRENDIYGAWLTLVENNPFPAIAGRICHHPCETACNRMQLDDAINICGLERFVGDEALKQGWRFPEPKASTGHSVAIIGGGPAGLSSAYQLARRGHKVTLFEAANQLGGLLRFGIPSYRLDKDIIDGEIARIIDLGVKVHLNSEILDDGDLKTQHQKYDAVYLATGATLSKNLPGIDTSQTWASDSADFLAATNAGQSCELGKDLIVIGGGSAAMDVARSARRLGRSVTVLALEQFENLPAQHAEVVEAKEEGVEFICGSMMQSVTVANDGLTLNCIGVNFSPKTERCSFQVETIDGSEFTLIADGIIPSIGQDVDLARWEKLLVSSDQVLKTGSQWQTTIPGIFAGGDVASMDRFVTQAVGMGKQAAAAIDRYISGQQASEILPSEPLTDYGAINTAYHSSNPRSDAESENISLRLKSFKEVQQGLESDQARSEAERCFSCGTCIFCDNCYLYCPDMAITKLDKGYEIKSDYCKGCGLCVAECPVGSIQMLEELS